MSCDGGHCVRSPSSCGPQGRFSAVHQVRHHFADRRSQCSIDPYPTFSVTGPTTPIDQHSRTNIAILASSTAAREKQRDRGCRSDLCVSCAAAASEDPRNADHAATQQSSITRPRSIAPPNKNSHFHPVSDAVTSITSRVCYALTLQEGVVVRRRANVCPTTSRAPKPQLAFWESLDRHVRGHEGAQEGPSSMA